MKKLFALFLVLAMLVPMGLMANATEDSPEVTVEPFVMLNWDEVKEGKFDNVFSAPFFWTAERVGLRISWNGASTPKDLALKVKELFDTRVEGARYIKFIAPSPYLKAYRENHVYMDKGADALKAWVEEFLQEYKAIGGQLDGFFLDVEIVDMGSYYLHQDAQDNPLLYNEIVSDPRYATEIRPLLEERGFKFWENVSDYTPEIYSISRNNTGEEYATARAIWDRVMRNRLADYINEAVCQPLVKYYPDALISDYQSADRGGWFKFLSDTGDNSFGEVTASGGSAVKVGNTSNSNVYYCRPSESFYTESGESVYKNPFSYNEAIYEQSAFNMTLWELNHFKNIYASTDTKNISAWITSYNYGTASATTSSETPYTTEIIYHLGMLNPQPFLGYIVETECADVFFYDRIEIVSQQLHELTRLVGYSDRQPIEVPANWNDSYILSGMYANGRNVWRITPDTAAVSLENFLVAGDDPTFYVDGKTITFPGGKIISDTKIDAVGSCGYWVETAADVTPIVTADADRYAQNPSLLVDFEDCKEGAFDYNNAVPIGAWELKWSKGSSAQVQTGETGKAMALNGTYSLKSIKLPANITAGDTYAEDQAWEITVTVPEGLSPEAELVLLDYAGSKQKTKDGGFKIVGGKLYYSKLGPADQDGKATQEYVELMDISAGTYTFKRVMDFNDPESFVSSYYVYNAQGKALKDAKNVEVPVFGTITSIGFAATKADKAVVLDNYKITITGSAADFELYYADTGIQVGDIEQPQTENTVYRLSWLNATDGAMTAEVIAQVYEGETKVSQTVLKQVDMQPGCDGVETGLVEVAEGQSVKVFVQTKVNKSLDMGMIIILAAAALAVVMVVVVLVITKKPAKKEEKPEE